MSEKIKIEIPEVVYLKIMFAHAQEEILSLRELKLSADEEVLRLFRKRLELETKTMSEEIYKTYAKFGVSAGDGVLSESGKFYILKSKSLNNSTPPEIVLTKPSILPTPSASIHQFPESLPPNLSDCSSLEKVPELEVVKTPPSLIEKQKEKGPNVSSREK